MAEAVEEILQIMQQEGKKWDVMIKIIGMKEMIVTDQTGKFPITSSKGAKYIMVMCEINGNVIVVETMKNRTDKEK